MSSTEKLLQGALESGMVAYIVYNGGSTPGQERPIIPVRIDFDSVYAREPGISRTSGLLREKSFKLERIAAVRLEDGRSAKNKSAPPAPSPPTLPVLATLPEYVSLLRLKYESLGWHVYETSGPAMFGVGKLPKSGKPRKHPSISICFIDRSVQLALNPETGEIMELRKTLTGRERPWRVDSPSMAQAKSFAELAPAMQLFDAEVVKSSSTG